jgi:hypothetical protein
MLTSVALAVLAVSPGLIALPPFTGGGLNPEARAAAAERLGQGLAARHYGVLGPGRLGEALSPEQQQTVAGCLAPEAGCFAGLARELGAASVAVGVVSAYSGRLAVEVRVVRATDGRLLAAARGQAANAAALEATLDELAVALVVEFEAAPEPPAALTGSSGLGVGFWAPVITGGVVIAAGAIALGTALSDLDGIRAARGVTLFDPEAGQQLERAIKQRNSGIAGMGLGAASILFGALFGRSEAAPRAPVALGGWVGSSGGGVVVQGRLW